MESQQAQIGSPTKHDQAALIAVVDSGVANLRSVSNTLGHLHANFKIAHTPADLVGAQKIILPGVGAFSAGMARLAEHGFIEPLQDFAAKGMPFLGICLGMQMLFERSLEMGDFAGLGLLKGTIIRFPTEGPKVPHIGWNELHHDGTSALLQAIPNQGSYAYFVHSYYANTDSETIIARTDHGIDFPSVVGRGNVFGAQFHPEKSQTTGLRLLRNFMEM